MESMIKVGLMTALFLRIDIFEYHFNSDTASMFSIKIIIRALLLYILLLLVASSTRAQVLSLEEYNCRYEVVLEEYLKRDSISPIIDIEELIQMVDCAQIEDNNLVDPLCDRILNISSDYSNPFVAKALYYKYLPEKRQAVWDSLITEVGKTNIGNGDVLRLLKVGRTGTQITPTNPKCVGVDSLLLSIVNEFEDEEHYYYAISYSLQMLSICASRRGESPLAISYEKQRMSIHNQYHASCARHRGNSFVSLGRRFQAAGKLDSAEVYFRKSKEFFMTYRPNVPEDFIMASVNIASCLNEQGYPLKMIEELKSAEMVATLDGNKDNNKSLSPDVSSSLGIVYNLLGQAYQDLGSDQSAIKYFQKSMTEVEEGGDQPTIQKLIAYANVGENLAKLGKEDLAEPYLMKALEYAEQLVGRKHYFTAVILMNIGNMEYQLDHLDECKKYYDQSLEIRKSIYGEEHQSLANVYVNYAKLFESMSEDDLIEEYYSKALSIYDQAYGDEHPLIAQALLKKAKYLERANRNNDALMILNEGELALGFKGNHEEVADIQTFLEIQYLKANIEYQQWAVGVVEDDNKVISSFQKAEEVLTYCLSITDDLRDRSGVAGKSKPFLDNYGLALLEISNKRNTDSLLYKSLAFSDRGKNQGLLYQLEKHANIITANLPREYVDERKECLSSLADLKFKRDKAIVGSDIFISLMDSINYFDDQLANIEDGIDSQFPFLNNIKTSISDVDVSSIQSGLSDSQVVLQITRIDNKVIFYLLYSDVLDYRVIEVSDDFDSEVLAYLESIATMEQLNGIENEDWVKVENVFSEFSTSVRSVTIIPDGPFLQFPFEMLNVEGKPLIEQYAISYANSMNVLARQSKIVKVDESYAFSGFAPTYQEQMDDVDEKPLIAGILRNGNWALPFASKEIEAIQKLVGGNLYTAAKANKNQFLKSVEKSNVIHMSMHALMDTKSPLNGRLLFGSEENDDEDLLLYELYNVHTNSPMVVLSACETGVGTYDEADGVQSLANGFLFAGVPSTIMSLWKVPDESTSQIMISFYKYLNQGKRKDESLRMAKLDYLDNVVSDKQKHPFYWAGFVVVGDTSPISFVSEGASWVYALLGFSILAFLFIFIRRKSI